MLKFILRKLNSLLCLKSKQACNYAMTLYVNLVLLPFKDAVKFPVLIYGKCYAYNLRGKILFREKVRRGMLVIGKSDPVRSFDKSTVLNVSGNIRVNGSVTIRRGLHLQVNADAMLDFGNHVFIGDNVTIICSEMITISSYSRIGNNCTFMDTDFHYIVNTESKTVNPTRKPIFIGENSWIAGYNVVKKGAVIPKGTIVAGPYSMIGKDYTAKIGEYCIIGGSPAKLIRENYRRINNDRYQQMLHAYFKEHTEPYIFPVDTDLDSVCIPDD